MESSSLFLSDPKAYAPAWVIRGGRLGVIDGVPQMPFARLSETIGPKSFFQAIDSINWPKKFFSSD